MQTEVSKKLFTVAEFERMGESGIFAPEERVELIDGEIIKMTPIGYRHISCVNRANALFVEAFGRRAVVSTQNSIILNDWTEPQPDLVIFKPSANFYADRMAIAADALFVVEIAETSLRYDRNIKLPRFAAAGIQETWIEDLQNDCLIVGREPESAGYSTILSLHRGDSISPLAFPDITFTINDLLG